MLLAQGESAALQKELDSLKMNDEEPRAIVVEADEEKEELEEENTALTNQV